MWTGAKGTDGTSGKPRSVIHVPLSPLANAHSWLYLLAAELPHVTFLCGCNVTVAVTELLEGLVISMGKLLTPSSELDAARCHCPMITWGTLFSEGPSPLSHFLDAFFFHESLYVQKRALEVTGALQSKGNGSKTTALLPTSGKQKK